MNAQAVVAAPEIGDALEEQRAPASPRGLRVLIFVVWLLCLASYSPAGRSAPLELGQLDWIGVLKVAVRFFAILVLGRALAVLLLGLALAHPGVVEVKRRTFRCLLPFALFAIWAAISTAWSPLQVVSLGHAGELVMLLMLSAVVGLVCIDDEHMSRVLKHLAVAMLLLGLASATMWRVGRGGNGTGPAGFMHPNLTAQTAGGGLLIVLAGALIWHWGWAKKLLIPAFAISGLVLFVAHSRTAIAATLLGIAACLFLGGRRKLLLSLSLAVIVAGVLYMTLDPYAKLYDDVAERTVVYTMRGQTPEQFNTASGRMEMWRKGLENFQESRLVGLGNWIMAPAGKEYLWREVQWQTLHNLVLHVLVGTGIIGALLFLWAMVRPLNAVRRGLRRDSPHRATAMFAVVMFIWFFAIGIYELSFMGPVSPVSVSFFVMLGLAASRL